MAWQIRWAVALVLLALVFGGASLPLPVFKKPIDLPGFNVLVLTERSEGATYEVVTRSPAVRDWLKANADAAYFWDDSHADFEYVDAAWKDAFSKAIEDSGGVRPWVLVSGNGGTSQELPGTADEFVKLLEKYK